MITDNDEIHIMFIGHQSSTSHHPTERKTEREEVIVFSLATLLLISPPQLNNLLWKNVVLGRVEEARQDLAAGANPNTRGGVANLTCLNQAAVFNHDQVVKMLLARPGIQVNAKSNSGLTALHYAAANGSLASLAMILSSPAQLNEKDNLGRTPIMLAAQRGRTEAVLQMATVQKVCLDGKDNKGRSLEEIANM